MITQTPTVPTSAIPRQSADHPSTAPQSLSTDSAEKNARTPTVQELILVTNEINDKFLAESLGVRLDIKIDGDTHKPVVTMLDNATGKTLRQIPSDTMLAIAKSIDWFRQHSFLDESA